MTFEEYKKFVEVTERHGGRVVIYAAFPGEQQKFRAQTELRNSEEFKDS